MERQQQLTATRAAAEELGLPSTYLDRLEAIAAAYDQLRRTGEYTGFGQPPESSGPPGIFIVCTPSTFFAWRRVGYQIHSYGLAGRRNGHETWFAEVRPPTTVNGIGT